MPEYLAPGVFVEEVSYRAKSIEGVSTTTTGFIGPTRFGPTDVEPEVLTSLVEYERIYGDRQQLGFADRRTRSHNYMWHAVRAFFENGGKRLYVQRVFDPVDPDDDASGQASAPLTGGGATVSSRFPGVAGKRRVRITLELGPNALALAAIPASELTSPPAPTSPPSVAMRTVLRGLQDRDIVWISRPGSPASPPGDVGRAGEFYLATQTLTTAGALWSFRPLVGSTALDLDDLEAHAGDPALSDEVRPVTATVTVYPTEEDGITQVWSGLALDPEHRSFGAADSLTHQFAAHPENLAWRRTVPIVVTAGPGVADGLQLLGALFAHKGALSGTLATTGTTADERSIDLVLDGGDDGNRPRASAYEGDPRDLDDKSGLKAFEDLEEISIVAAPGSTADYRESDWESQAATVVQLLIGHAERMRYRIAVLDSGAGQDITEVRAMRAALDSKHAALYYPWVRVVDPVTQDEIALPPSGFVAGIYARNDIQRAVYKAPANEVVTLALGFERTLNKAQQEVLNPEGVNCLRFFEGRGNRVWGARTVSSDPEWKYVNLRRYFAYLERSIDVGTQWAVFEPNGPALWANVRRTVSDFLFNEFVMGAYLGDKPETSYFVKCDRSTMTQNDIDNGRLVCQIGVAVVKPAEFVIFRVGQWTADARR
jgi:phage tail sheath protein FI